MTDDHSTVDFDPSEHTVDEVNEYLAEATPDERDRVLAEEAAGKARVTVQAPNLPADPETLDEGASPRRALRRGHDGEDVAYVQGLLSKARFEPSSAFDSAGRATGVYDYHTERAVKKFQFRKRLPVTGEVDADTLAALEG